MSSPSPLTRSRLTFPAGLHVVERAALADPPRRAVLGPREPREEARERQVGELGGPPGLVVEHDRLALVGQLGADQRVARPREVVGHRVVGDAAADRRGAGSADGVQPGDVLAGHDRAHLGLRRVADDVAGHRAGVVAAGAQVVLVEDLLGDADDRGVRAGLDGGVLHGVRGVQHRGVRAELVGQREVDDQVEVVGQLGLVGGLVVDLGQLAADGPQRVVPDRGVQVHAAVVGDAADGQRPAERRVEDVEVVVHGVAVEHVAGGQRARRVRRAQGLGGLRGGAAVLAERRGVPLVVVVADDVAEVVGERLVQRARLAGVVEAGGRVGHAVRHLVAGDVEGDQLHGAVRALARVAVDHLLEGGAEEGVAELRRR